MLREFTERNIRFYSNQELLQRFKRIDRMLTGKRIYLHPDDQKELIQEKELIIEHMKRRGASSLLSEQMVLDVCKVPPRQTYARAVVNALRDYYVKKMRIEELKRQSQGIEILFPSCVSSYSEVRVTSNEYTSTTEKAVLRQYEILEKIEQEILELMNEIQEMERALASLDEDERILIEERYLKKREPKDEAVIQKMHISRSQYYKLKQQAFLKIAESLHLLQTETSLPREEELHCDT